MANNVYPQTQNVCFRNNPETHFDYPRQGSFDYPPLNAQPSQQNIQKFDFEDFDVYFPKQYPQIVRNRSVNINPNSIPTFTKRSTGINDAQLSHRNYQITFNTHNTKPDLLPVIELNNKCVNTSPKNNPLIKIEKLIENVCEKNRSKTPHFFKTKESEKDKKEMKKFISQNSTAIFIKIDENKNGLLNVNQSFKGVCRLFKFFYFTPPIAEEFTKVINQFKPKKKGFFDRFEFLALCIFLTGY